MATPKPIKSKIYLSQINKEVTLNFFTLADDDSLDNEFGGTAELNRRFSAMDYQVVLFIMWMLMDDVSKQIISETKLYTWDGLERKPFTTTDPVEKLKKIICGAEELANIFLAILATRTASNPDQLENSTRKKPEGSP